MNWTDERVELLKKLWAEGLSASQIANQLGGVSRNAVIGKVHRLKLSGRGRASAAQPRAKKAPAAGTAKTASRPVRTVVATVGATALAVQFDAEPVARQVLRPAEDVVVPISRRLNLIQLTERTCKWPNGDPLAEDFSFCGNEAGESGPYCGYHSRIAYQPASERRRLR
ncbi:MAG: GcrA cell cycle regulator [Hyphomicrobiales bacterium]|nr:MAG: GcrA cell cycle regulator [Hyphomicrobiales bacterium]